MLERRVAIITGAASGIGLETTKRFLQDPKYNPIFAVDINPSVETIFTQSQYPNVISLRIDMGTQKQVRAMFQRVSLESGRLDVLVNAAGVMYKGLPEAFWDRNKAYPKEWEKMEQVNVWGPIVAMDAASQLMNKNDGGVIVNISSAKYLFPDIHHIEYQRGKMALSRVTKRLAKSFMENYRVRLVDVQPGNTKTNIDQGVWTEGNRKSEIEAAESINRWWRRKFGNDPENVAEVIYQVAEGNIQGTTIYVGSDTKIGRALFLLTYPLGGYRWDSIFFAGSLLFYQIARGINILKNLNK